MMNIGLLGALFAVPSVPSTFLAPAALGAVMVTPAPFPGAGVFGAVASLGGVL